MAGLVRAVKVSVRLSCRTELQSTELSDLYRPPVFEPGVRGFVLRAHHRYNGLALGWLLTILAERNPEGGKPTLSGLLKSYRFPSAKTVIFILHASVLQKRYTMTDTRPSQKYSLLIGSITAYWSVTEYLCDQALALLLRIDSNLSRCITAHVADFAVRLDILKAVSKQAIEDEQLLEEFQAILQTIATASRERDNVVHSVWFNLGYEDLTDTKYSFEPGSVPIVGSTKYKPPELKRVLDQTKEATEALTTFLLDRLGMPPGAPGIVIEST